MRIPKQFVISTLAVPLCASILTSLKLEPTGNPTIKPGMGARIKGSHPLADGLVLMLPFNQPSQTENDLTSSNITMFGHVGGTGAPDWKASPYGWAAGPYDGTLHWFESLATPSGLPSGSAARTISVLFRVETDSTTKQTILEYGHEGTNGATWVMCYSGTTDNNGTKANSLSVDFWFGNTYIPWTWDARWHLLTTINPAGNTNTGGVLLCLDGVCPSTLTNGTQTLNTVNNTTLLLGRLHGGTSLTFNGSIAGVWAWNYALDAAKVSQLWQEPFAMLTGGNRAVATPGAPTVNTILRRRTVTIQ